MAAEIIYVELEEQLQYGMDIRKKVFVDEQKVPLELEIDEYDNISPDVHHVLIQDNGEYVATGRIIYYDDDTAKMQRIAVLKEYRAKGFGRVLMIAMEELALELGLHYAVLDAQIQAENFYAKQGYEVISKEPFLDAGIMHVRMKKKL
ncbi:GNAT family N-acetyltransferase [Paenibacillus crassostreae]|uniref:GCN5 family acetyltransferase n=1 Tax=Paenibacillus crassostreae TaxID=1763538 RepID=A0A162RL15_9BACL|nr:GNAT family N-acetyltransferase [Paenibacillus crassostreae]AOZ91579.1 GNAT family N-acetyltransferase [Paenibacillus crassostreae]OAB72847.1 GCN5 family acetyltransferase [Paenibacillus crassostreae]